MGKTLRGISIVEAKRKAAAPIGVLHPLAEDLCRVARGFYERGWCLGTSGNFSVVLADAPLRLLVTASGRNKGELTRNDLVVVGADGEPVDGASGRPSAEARLHGVIAGATGARAVLHTHSVAGTLLGEHHLSRGGFTLTGYEMMKGLEGIESHEARVFVPVLRNSQDMRSFGTTVAALLAERPEAHGFLIAGHGLYTWGRTLPQAQRHVEIFEFLLECLARRTAFRFFSG